MEQDQDILVSKDNLQRQPRSLRLAKFLYSNPRRQEMLDMFLKLGFNYEYKYIDRTLNEIMDLKDKWDEVGIMFTSKSTPIGGTFPGSVRIEKNITYIRTRNAIPQKNKFKKPRILPLNSVFSKAEIRKMFQEMEDAYIPRVDVTAKIIEILDTTTVEDALELLKLSRTDRLTYLDIVEMTYPQGYTQIFTI